MSWSVIEAWLRSLGLHHYTQSFIDNGYDDLDVCRQIGEPDLDAIGVTTVEDRCAVLEAVSELQQSVTSAGAGVTSSVTPVYFTLENPDTTQSSGCRLSTLVSERLTDDAVTLSEPPYCSQVIVVKCSHCVHARMLCTHC